jgi:hypothetical protein
MFSEIAALRRPEAARNILIGYGRVKNSAEPWDRRKEKTNQSLGGYTICNRAAWPSAI